MEGKVAIVTGGAGGIGEGIVRALLAKGVRVVATGRSEAKLARLGETLGNPGYASIAVDITADDATADENVIGTLFVYQARIWGESIVDVVERGQSFPGHGEIAFFKCLD